MGAGMGAGDFYKGRLSGGCENGSLACRILVQWRNLKQHAASIEGCGKVLAHRRLLASEQHDDLSPVVCHGGQQLDQAVRKRRDATHAYRAGTCRKVAGQCFGHHVGRHARLNHIAAIQAIRVGA